LAMELELLPQLGIELVTPEPINQSVEPFSHGVLTSTKQRQNTLNAEDAEVARRIAE